MPGIFGFVSTRTLDEAPRLAREMGALLSSHGQQRSSAVCGPRFALGATWMPGLQLDPGPMTCADGRRWVVATGEVYPSGGSPIHPPASPTSLVDAALAANDPARLARVNGQFAGAVVHPESASVELVCDRYGLHSLYWTVRDGIFAFASEAKALLALPGVGRDLDPEGVATFLLIGEHFSDRTLLAGVRMAPAASIVRSSGAPPVIRRFWQVRYSCSVTRAEESAAAREAGRLFRRAVERQTAGTDRIGVPLSGGLDSRICVAAVPEGRRGEVTTFTFGDPGCFDRRFGQATARRCGVRNLQFDYRYAGLVEGAALGAWITDGVAGATDFHMLPYVDDIARDADVVLNGFAGDALLGGNFHWRRLRSLPRSRLPRAAFAKRNDCVAIAEAGRLLRGDARDAARDVPAAFEAAFEPHLQEDPLGTLDAFLLDSRVRRWTSFGTQLLRTRVVSRAPFYDNDFFDFVATVPPAWRTDHSFYRQVLLHTFPDVAQVGWQTTGLPPSWPAHASRLAGAVLARGCGLAERLTRGMLPSPYPAYRSPKAFRGPLSARLRSDLFGGPGRHWEVFDRNAGERVWQELQSGADGRAKLVGVLLTLRHFLDQCAGDRRPASPLTPDRVRVEALPLARPHAASESR